MSIFNFLIFSLNRYALVYVSLYETSHNKSPQAEKTPSQATENYNFSQKHFFRPPATNTVENIEKLP